MWKLALISLLVLDFGFCSRGNDDVDIRLLNRSSLRFTEIVVNTSSGTTNFEDLQPGQTSAYQTFETAYRYAFVELTADGQIYTIQPIDYVGETPLDGGSYTYELSLASQGDRYGSLILTLKKD